MKDKENYVKLKVKLSNTIEAKYYENGNKELFSNRLNFNLKIINAKKNTIIVSRAVKVLTKDVDW